MDVEIPVLAGYLNVPTQSGFSLKKKSTQRYCLLFKSSRHGIERLEICENKDDKNPKIITLENCVKITQESAPLNQIQIVKMTGTLTLNTLTEDDLKEWVTALQTVAFRDKGGGSNRNTTIEEENDLYCSSFGDGLFIVKLIPSDTSIRCQIEPKNYMLHLTATELQLKSAEDLNIVIAKWPFRFIRKYGYRDGKFTFEAGRKCSTGEGVFTLDHTNPREIFRCMSSKMKSMKKLISGESLNSLDCGENQLSAALSMEAGSRSPLPPSPNQPLMHQNSTEFDQSLSCASIRGFLSSNDSLNNVSMNSNSTISVSANNSISTSISSTSKIIPNKPPRKLPGLNNNSPNTDKGLPSPINQTSPTTDNKQQQNCDKFKKIFQNYEPVSLLVVTDAQKTGSTVILKSPSPELKNRTPSPLQNSHHERPPDLPLRNDNSKKASPGRSGTERDYERIENITEAWKTLGMNDIKHTEHVGAPDDDLREFAWQRTQSQRDNNRQKLVVKEIHSTPTTPITNNSVATSINGRLKLIESDSDSNYDRLDFLQKTNKSSDSSGYKTIVTVSQQVQSQPKKKEVTINDYELIASPDIQTCRLADDSYLGYGVLRQPSVPGPQVPSNANKNISSTMINDTGTTGLGHKNYNGMSYAIVSKPKRV